MKNWLRVLKVVLFVFVVLAIGYFIYTGTRV